MNALQKSVRDVLLCTLFLTSIGVVVGLMCGCMNARALAQYPQPYPVQYPQPFRRPPMRVVLPPPASQPAAPSTVVNIYEDGITTEGPAKIKRHRNGIEVQQQAPPPSSDPCSNPYRQQRPEPLPTEYTPRRSANPQDDTLWSRSDRQGILFRSAICGFVILLVILIVLAIKFRVPIKETAANADLSDGVGDEVKELLNRVKDQLKAEQEEKPTKATPKKTASKK